MDTLEVYRTLSNVTTFVGVFSSKPPANSSAAWKRQVHAYHKYRHPDRTRKPLGRIPPRHKILVRLLLRVLRSITARPGHTALPLQNLHSVELQQSHATGFHHGRVWTVHVSVRALHGPGIRPLPVCRPLWDAVARPTDGNCFRAGVWTTPTS